MAEIIVGEYTLPSTGDKMFTTVPGRPDLIGCIVQDTIDPDEGVGISKGIEVLLLQVPSTPTGVLTLIDKVDFEWTPVFDHPESSQINAPERLEAAAGYALAVGSTTSQWANDVRTLYAYWKFTPTGIEEIIVGEVNSLVEWSQEWGFYDMANAFSSSQISRNQPVAKILEDGTAWVGSTGRSPTTSAFSGARSPGLFRAFHLSTTGTIISDHWLYPNQYGYTDATPGGDLRLWPGVVTTYEGKGHIIHRNGKVSIPILTWQYGNTGTGFKVVSGLLSWDDSGFTFDLVNTGQMTGTPSNQSFGNVNTLMPGERWTYGSLVAPKWVFSYSYNKVGGGTETVDVPMEVIGPDGTIYPWSETEVFQEDFSSQYIQLYDNLQRHALWTNMPGEDIIHNTLTSYYVPQFYATIEALNTDIWGFYGATGWEGTPYTNTEEALLDLTGLVPPVVQPATPEPTLKIYAANEIDFLGDEPVVTHRMCGNFLWNPLGTHLLLNYSDPENIRILQASSSTVRVSQYVSTCPPPAVVPGPPLNPTIKLPPEPGPSSMRVYRRKG